MQKILCLIARLIVARHECTYVQHCKENAPIYMYYVALETPMMSSVIADCPDLAPPQYFGQVYLWSELSRLHRLSIEFTVVNSQLPNSGKHYHFIVVDC